MADKESKKSEFVVNDRRLFSSDGELRQDMVEAEERAAERERETKEAQQRTNDERAAQQSPAKPQVVEPAIESEEQDAEGPTAAEHQASSDAYAASTKKMDYRIRKELDKQGQGDRAQDFEMNFEKFAASLYMTTLMQLGLAAPQGEKPQLDLMGARQTIDILGMLQDRTKGNLSPAEEGTLRNILYELRMAYLEVTNLIANPPKGAGVPTEN
jgi:Domain of unknown function (DUF1844)